MSRNSQRRPLDTTRFMFRLIWQQSSPFVFLSLAAALFNLLMPLALVLLPRVIVDELLHTRDPANVLLYLAAMFVVGVAVYGVDHWLKYRQSHASQRLSLNIDGFITALGLTTRFDLVESAAFKQLRDRAFRPIRNQGALTGFIASHIAFIQHALLLLSLSILIARTQLPILLILIVCAVLSELLRQLKLKDERRLERALSDLDRRYEYYDRLIGDVKAAKEVRIYALSNYIMGKVRQDNRFLLRRIFTRLYIGKGLCDGAISALGVLRTLAIFIVLIAMVSNGTLTIGAFVMLLTASTTITSTSDALLLSRHESQRYTSYLRDFQAFVELCQANSEQRQATAETPDAAQRALLPIRFEDVSFHYGGDPRLVLRDINLSFEAGKRYVLVGRNGAGKSTLLKLALGLYAPSSGRITIAGSDVSGLELRQSSRPMFQDFQIFPLSMKENVRLGEAEDEAQYARVAQWTGLEQIARSLIHGADSLLPRGFTDESTDLSGGQFQRVALARSLYAGGTLLILDEPTAAIDPRDELRIYTELGEVAQATTTIIVSHRMASCRFCDEVLVLEEGALVGRGSHQQLLQTCSVYRALWEAQAQHYVDA